MADIEAVKLPAGWRRVTAERVGSTNKDALAARLDDPTWFVAGEQIEGRGRRGRAWISPPGNLHATAGLSDPCEMARLPELPFVAAVAACDAVRSFHAGAKIKWPNDILLDGAKVAGLLAESSFRSGVLTVACGFGMNSAHAPDAALYRTRALAVPRALLFEALAAAFDSELRRWSRQGFDVVRERWLSRAAGLGQPLVARLGTGRSAPQELHGTFEALEADGTLSLRMADGSRRGISAGDIFFPGM